MLRAKQSALMIFPQALMLPKRVQWALGQNVDRKTQSGVCSVSCVHMLLHFFPPFLRCFILQDVVLQFSSACGFLRQTEGRVRWFKVTVLWQGKSVQLRLKVDVDVPNTVINFLHNSISKSELSLSLKKHNYLRMSKPKMDTFHPLNM